MTEIKVKSDRMLNNYRVTYMPKYHRAMTSKNWKGYVYEHIMIAEQMTGRHLKENEVVHHLDGNRSNNRIENLLVLSRAMHTKLHNWMNNGGIFKETKYVKRVNSEESKEVRTNSFCKICNITLQGKQISYCSITCRGIGRRKVIRPSKIQLKKDIEQLSWIAIAKKYYVSDNAVRKWAKTYKLL